jgi:hypothetical protein
MWMVRLRLVVGKKQKGLKRTPDFDEVGMPRLLSVNVGLPRDVTWNGKTVHTAIWKSPVAGRRMVRRLNIIGDAQGDLAGHGGEQRAVFVYQMDSYQYWERFLGRNDFIYPEPIERPVAGNVLICCSQPTADVTLDI